MTSPRRFNGYAMDSAAPDRQRIADGPLAGLGAKQAEAVICEDLEGRITRWGHDAERIFGYSAEEIVGRPALQLIPPEREGEHAWILRQLAAGKSVRAFDSLRRDKDGRPIEVTVTALPIRDADGRIIGASEFVRENSGLQQYAAEIVRLTRLYSALSAINQAIIRAPTREVLLAETCSGLVTQGGFAAAWIGRHDPGTHRLMPIAHYGDAASYLGEVEVYTDERPEGCGPTGRAFRAGMPYVCNDFNEDPTVLPWRRRLLAQGWRASAALPIRSDGQPWGALTVYAQQANVFEEREIGLLVEAANDVSFALDNLAQEAARQQAEQAVRVERDFTAALINSLPGVLYAYDECGRFLRWNANFERVTGYSAEEIRCMHPIDFFGEAERELVGNRIAEVFDKGSSSVEASLRARNGELTPYYFTGVRAHIGGRTSLVGVGIDLTERKRAEHAQQMAEEITRDTVSELARVTRVSLLGEFAASVAHEVNQPLAAVVTNGDAALRWLNRDPPDLNQVRAAIERIGRDARQASEVVKRLRAMVTRTTPVYTDLDLNRVITDVLLFMQGMLNRAGVTLHCDLAPQLPPVSGDSVQLQQVVLNLLTNAVEAMQAVPARPPLLRITTSTEDDQVLTRIEDSGPGLDPATIGRVFDHFFTTKSGGTGLGLAIARTIVEAHGGSLRARPGVAQGAVFEFALPRSPERSA